MLSIYLENLNENIIDHDCWKICLKSSCVCIKKFL